MKFNGFGAQSKYKKTLATIGAVTVGATLLVGVTQINSASAAGKHQGCAYTSPPHYFVDPAHTDWGPTAHYYKAGKFENRGNNDPQPENATICTREDIIAVNGLLEKSPHAPSASGGDAGGGAPAPAPAPGVKHQGCTKTVLPWFFKGKAHWYSEAPKKDAAGNYTNAHDCDPSETGSNPAAANNGAGAEIGAINSGPPAGVNPDDRADGKSADHPFPANKSLLAAPKGCQNKVPDGQIRVWKFLGRANRPEPAGWYECHKDQISDKSEAAQAQGTAEIGPATTDNGKLVERIAKNAYDYAKNPQGAQGQIRASYRKANINDQCRGEWTDSDAKRAPQSDVAWMQPNNGNWCQLPTWPIFLAQWQRVFGNDPEGAKAYFKVYTTPRQSNGRFGDPNNQGLGRTWDATTDWSKE
jgi:hypothetical protein